MSILRKLLTFSKKNISFFILQNSAHLEAPTQVIGDVIQ